MDSGYSSENANSYSQILVKHKAYSVILPGQISQAIATFPHHCPPLSASAEDPKGHSHLLPAGYKYRGSH